MAPVAEAQRYAADLEYKAAQDALDLYREQYEQGRADMQPRLDLSHAAIAQIDNWRDAGGQLYKPWKQKTAAELEMDPGYQFRLEEGERSIRRMRNLEGGQSGATAKALLRHGQRLASEEYARADARDFRNYRANYAREADRVGRLFAMAGLGPNPGSAMANFGMQYAGQAAQTMQRGAAARGAGEVGAQNALLSGQMMQYRHTLNANQQMLGAIGSIAGAATGGYFGGLPGAVVGMGVGSQLSGFAYY